MRTHIFTALLGTLVLAAASVVTGCGADEPTGEPAGDGMFTSGCSMTATASLTGAPIGGQTPSGDAKAVASGSDCTTYTTTLTVSVKDLNLPDGTVLTVTDAFTPVGMITLSGGKGSLSTNLGHFFPAGDTIRVVDATTTYLAGKMHL
jgi:hypothetical protein